MDDLLAEFERPHQTSPEDRERRRRLFAAVGIAGLSLVAIGSLTTNALFTDTDSVNSSGFVTGTVDIAASPDPVNFNAGNMAPGDVVYGALQVLNSGSLGLRYAVTATADVGPGTGTGVLRDQLDFSLYRGAATCDAAGVAAATLVGTTGPIGGAGKTFSTFVDDDRLGAGASDDLCAVASLPIGTGNTFQDTSTTVTFVFDAEQTKNN